MHLPYIINLLSFKDQVWQKLLQKHFPNLKHHTGKTNPDSNMIQVRLTLTQTHIQLALFTWTLQLSPKLYWYSQPRPEEQVVIGQGDSFIIFLLSKTVHNTLPQQICSQVQIILIWISHSYWSTAKERKSCSLKIKDVHYYSSKDF